MNELNILGIVSYSMFIYALLVCFKERSRHIERLPRNTACMMAFIVFYLIAHAILDPAPPDKIIETSIVNQGSALVLFLTSDLMSFLEKRKEKEKQYDHR